MKTLSITLCLLFIPIFAYGEVVCRDKRTGNYVNDFQTLVKKDGTLIGNAVRAGLGNPEDFEEIEVSREEFWQIEKQINELFRSILLKEQEKQKKEAKDKAQKDAFKKLKELGLTEEQLEALFE